MSSKTFISKTCVSEVKTKPSKSEKINEMEHISKNYYFIIKMLCLKKKNFTPFGRLLQFSRYESQSTWYLSCRHMTGLRCTLTAETRFL